MRKQYDDVEKRRLVKEWDESGLSAAAFSGARGLHPVTLAGWGREIRGPLRKARSRARPVPREVEVVEVPPARVSEVRVELEWGRDRRLVVTGEVTAEMIAELVFAADAGATS